MEKKIALTKTEIEILKQTAIREYKMKHDSSREVYDSFSRMLIKIKRIAPVNIVVGVTAGILLVLLKGWETLLYLFLSVTVVVTLISAFLGLFVKK